MAYKFLINHRLFISVSNTKNKLESRNLTLVKKELSK